MPINGTILAKNNVEDESRKGNTSKNGAVDTVGQNFAHARESKLRSFDRVMHVMHNAIDPFILTYFVIAITVSATSTWKNLKY